jgi:alkanesulfonate monooxygenase SsuD/methylene tetrahydromethanopterin reductase-like flavin-dependent oxidoreductase (luciferase family)
MIIGITIDVANDESLTLDEQIDAVKRSEQQGFDVVVLPDSFGRDSHARGFDAELVAATVASLTSSIALIPATDTTHTEPFHLAKNLATLDIVSDGRAGWWPRVSLSSEESKLFGRRAAPSLDEAWAEASDAVEVVRRLWDSWEDGAVIRDVATGRYIDIDKVHYVDFVGPRFSVRGPSITPRSPQGQLPIWVDTTEPGAEVLIDQADLVVIHGESDASYEERRGEIRASQVRAGRDANGVRVIAAVHVVLVDAESTPATNRGLVSEFVGTPRQLNSWLLALEATSKVDGVVLRPTDDASRQLLRSVDVTGRITSRTSNSGPSTLRERLGLERPESRYAPVQP